MLIVFNTIAGKQRWPMVQNMWSLVPRSFILLLLPDYCVLEPLHISQLVQSEGTLPSQQDPLLLLLLHLVMMVFAFKEMSMNPKISIKPFCVPRVAFSSLHYLWGQSETMILPRFHPSGLEITIKTTYNNLKTKGKVKKFQIHHNNYLKSCCIHILATG